MRDLLQRQGSVQRGVATADHHHFLRPDLPDRREAIRETPAQEATLLGQPETAGHEAPQTRSHFSIPR